MVQAKISQTWYRLNFNLFNSFLKCSSNSILIYLACKNKKIFLNKRIILIYFAKRKPPNYKKLEGFPSKQGKEKS
tara:strand:+ start:5825 stop:6049 length:225 start_codon:yes stop_codon:yes gene_type:complete